MYVNVCVCEVRATECEGMARVASWVYSGVFNQDTLGIEVA